jgi:predicted PurR-regulated permease PerM
MMKERLFRERVFFFAMVGALALLTLIMVWPFMNAILLAIAVVVILKPVYNWFLHKRWINGNESRANVATIATFVLVIAIPTILILGGAVRQAAVLFRGFDAEDYDLSTESIIVRIEETIQEVAGEGFQIDEGQVAVIFQDITSAVIAWFGDVVISLGASLPKFFTTVVIVLVIMAVLLPRYKRPGRQAMIDIIPFPKEITQLYLEKIDLMITAMFKGTFVLAIVQGLAMGVVLWIAGVPYVSVLTILSMFVSIIPIAGISWVAWPVSIILILTGDVVEGIFVIAAFLVVVSNIDTVLRPRLVPREVYLNPVLVILSVFGGIQLMGIIGILYGPVIMILLVTSIEVYTKYILRSDLEVVLARGDLDLEELGLVADEDEVEETGSGMVVALARNLIARFQQGPSERRDEPGESPA